MNTNNNSETIASSPTEILKIMILDRRNSSIDALEAYYQALGLIEKPPTHIIKARIWSMYQLIRSAYKRTEGETQSYKIDELLKSKKYDDLLLAYQTLDEWMDRKRITMIDLKQRYDQTKVEDENEAMGL